MDQYLQGLFILANDPTADVRKLVSSWCLIVVNVFDVTQIKYFPILQISELLMPSFQIQLVLVVVWMASSWILWSFGPSTYLLHILYFVYVLFLWLRRVKTRSRWCFTKPNLPSSFSNKLFLFLINAAINCDHSDFHWRPGLCSICSADWSPSVCLGGMGFLF
jgi:hypothetical protein